MTEVLTGECQVCGRVQKLVDGRLANHGYRRPGTGWGNAGTCDGSRYLPAPAVSAIDATIERNQWHIARAEKELAEFAAPGYVWPAGVVPQLAINSRRQGVESCRKNIESLNRRRAELLARAQEV